MICKVVLQEQHNIVSICVSFYASNLHYNKLQFVFIFAIATHSNSKNKQF